MGAMEITPPQSTTQRKTRRRWFQFSIRSMMLAITLLCVWLGVISHRANRQKRAVEAIRSKGGSVEYDYESRKYGGRNFPRRGSPSPPGPVWLQNLVGLDYFATVVVAGVGHDAADDDSVAVLVNLPELRCVSLVGAGVTQGGLARLKELPNLVSLDLENSSATSAGWEPLERLTQLEELTLSGDNVTDSTLSYVEGLRHLTLLHVNWSQITDAGLEHLGCLTRLKSLWLDSDKLTDAGLRHLTTLTQLQDLDLSRTKITKGGIDDLRRVLPSLEVTAHPAR